ncbi:hypothetical protein FQN57_003163 [Myotisia sp. PD_48]|nr:hypothetical protein FQN57_003163 [Myotisia sp. PD_48]
MFSYLRRDHRRASASCAPPSKSPQPQSQRDAPQLPTTFETSNLTDEFFESSVWANSSTALAPIGEINANTALQFGQQPIREQELSYCSVAGKEEFNVSPVSVYMPSSPTMGRLDHNDTSFHRTSSPWKRARAKGSTQETVKGDGNNSPGGYGKAKVSLDGAGPEHKYYPRDSKSKYVSSRRGGNPEPNEPGHQLAPKTRLNLLNPMALLARRRSAQVVNLRSEDINISNLTVPALPDDYDPRIRGKLIHDFSVPRARPVAADFYFATDKPALTRRPEHAPLFKEHFEDIVKQHNEIPTSQSNNSKIASNTTSINDNTQPHIRIENEKQQERPQVTPPSTSHRNKSPPSTVQPQSSTARDSSFTPLGLPKHLTSSASRFSFDLTGGDSASQERLMEEKHKEKEAARKAHECDKEGSFDAEHDDYDYDIMLDDDGLEEKIPGINADADSFADVDEGPDPQDWLDSMHGDSQTNTAISLALVKSEFAGMEAFPTPLPDLSQQPSALFSPDNATFTPSQPHVLPLELSSDDSNLHPAPLSPSSQSQYQTQLNSRTPDLDDDDDLYFDDGLFGDLPHDMRGSNFDESIFDDETSHLYDKKKRVEPSTTEITCGRPSFGNIESNGFRPALRTLHMTGSTRADDSSRNPRPATLDAKPIGSASLRIPSYGLTQGNLEAYHNALADAANEAAREGRFDRCINERRTSQEFELEANSQTAESHPCLTADESRLSQTVETVGVDESFDDFDYYDDDELDNDPIIAEANADVLENDDEGFYGQEFGFYAHSNGNNNAERVYGGYFGSKGADGLIRNQSARKNFKEPSLTPITERSEWSTRNSIISLAAHGAGHANQSISSPPLSQLVDMENFDDEMSLSALLKLRRGAWGGSNGNLQNNTNSQTTQYPPTNSPSSRYGSFSGVYDTDHPDYPTKLAPSLRAGDASNIVATDEDLYPVGLRLKCDGSNRRHSDVIVQTPANWDPVKRSSFRSFDEEKSGCPPTTHGAGGRISYVKGMDESGSECWVLEKRRMSGSGDCEILEREEMVYGRI